MRYNMSKNFPDQTPKLGVSRPNPKIINIDPDILWSTFDEILLRNIIETVDPWKSAKFR